MPIIKPASALRNDYVAISRLAREFKQPVFLTKNGTGDMVIMSLEAYEDKQFETEIYYKLREAEKEAKSTTKRFSHEEVLSSLRRKIGKE